MNNGIKFDTLANTICENNSYRLNADGVKKVKQYHDLIKNLESIIESEIGHLVKNDSKIYKQVAIQIVSTINANKEGNDDFDVMVRLDTLTNGGRTHIDGGMITFNQKDKILQYLENI